MEAILPILSRWIHVLTACIALGGVFFMRVVVPVGIRSLEEPMRSESFLRLRSIFKKVIHTAILLFLITGTYNAILTWPRYASMKGLGHGLFGLHLLLALIVFGISLYATAGKQPPKNHRGLMLANLVLLVFVVLAASTLKWARERAMLSGSASAASATVD